jgi:hypothetical protein
VTARSASTAGSWPGSSSRGRRRRGQTAGKRPAGRTRRVPGEAVDRGHSRTTLQASRPRLTQMCRTGPDLCRQAETAGRCRLGNHSVALSDYEPRAGYGVIFRQGSVQGLL